MPFTVHLEMPVFQQVDEQKDKQNAMLSAHKLSLAAMQDFVLVYDEERRLIAIVFKGDIFEKSYPKEDKYIE
jgi:hypothetical protein